MAVTISGSTGIAGVDGSAGTPAVQGVDTNTGMFFPAADTVGVSTGGTERMRVDSSGNVGIGTTSPSERLSVHSAIGIRGSNFASTSYFGSSVNTTGVYTGLDSAGGFAINVRDSGYITLSTNNTERARMDSGGNLLVGTTSNNGVVTSFTSSNTGRAGFFMVNAASSLAADALGVSKFDNNTTTSQVFVKFFINNNSAASGLITANGANQAAFTSSSDARLKENITPLDPQLEKICSLKPCEFDYKDGTGRQIGFIAQEVKEIYPDLVGENKDGMFTLSDMNKNDARLIKAIQELKAQNDELKARVEALEANGSANVAS